MNDAVIQPCRGKNEPRLPACGLLFLNPAEAGQAARTARRVGWRRHFLFHSNLYVSSAASAFWAGPAVGAPMAVICLEKLIALGATQIVVCGWCGSLQADLAVGELVLPIDWVSEEGVSAHYPLAGPVAPSAGLVTDLGDFLTATWRTAREGAIWTTDALYRETRDKVRRYGQAGVLAVEMEFSALLRVAAFRGVELAGLMLVSDLLWPAPWQPGFADKEFRRRSQALVDDLLSWVGKRPQGAAVAAISPAHVPDVRIAF